MNKGQLADRLAEKTGLSNKSAYEVVDCIFSTQGIIATELDAGNSVTITGFGTFDIRHRQAREVRNPRTGEKMMAEAKKVPAFKAGKGLKDRIKG